LLVVEGWTRSVGKSHRLAPRAASGTPRCRWFGAQGQAEELLGYCRSRGLDLNARNAAAGTGFSSFWTRASGVGFPLADGVPGGPPFAQSLQTLR
jgi:hypothetical protein